MRPAEIVWFEGIQLVLIAFIAFSIAWQWHDADGMALRAGISPAFTAAFSMLSAILSVTLVLLTTRRRSRAAMWVLVAVFLFGFASDIRRLANTGSPIPDGQLPWEFVVICVADLVSLWLLFTPSARRWLRHRADTTITAG